MNHSNGSNFRVIRWLANSVFIVTLSVAVSGCGPDNVARPPTRDPTVVGFTTVPLDANKPVVRGGEAVIGNLVADAIYAAAVNQGRAIDAAVMNGGNIRFNSALRVDGIYPAGELTQDNVNEIAPFKNELILFSLTGAELKTLFERSVHALPVPTGSSGNGAFLQVSAQLQIIVDLNQQPQILDELNDPVTIITPGQRIVSVTLNGIAIDPNMTYRIVVPDFIGGGGDGYVALGQLPTTRQIPLALTVADALKAYLLANQPVSPAIDGRTIIQ